MVRTLVYLEGLVALALAILLPFIAADLLPSLALPLSIVILVPLCASISVRPLGELRAALAAAFTSRSAEGDPRETEAVLAELGGYLRRSVILGVIACAVAAAPMAGRGRTASEWFALGAWLALYGILGALATRILALAVARLALAPTLSENGAAPGIEHFRGKYGVSPREWEVATCIAAGASYKETADRLFISLSTVKAHLSSVYRKTGTRDKIELVILMRREGC